MRILLQKRKGTVRRSAIDDPVFKVRIVLRQNTFDRRANEFFSIERRSNDRNLHAHAKGEAGSRAWENTLPVRDLLTATTLDCAERSLEASKIYAGSLCYVDQKLGIIPDCRA